MERDPRYSLDGAAAAGRDGELGEWVRTFLASPGSDNGPLGAKLSEELGWWAGPLQLPIDQLNRLAGPAGDPVACPLDDDDWDQRVDDMEERAQEGWEPPPVIVSYRDDRLQLEDGNHRVESLRRAGRRQVWAVIGFEREEDRDRGLAEWGPAAVPR